MKFKVFLIPVGILLLVLTALLPVYGSEAAKQALDSWHILGPLPISDTEVKLLADEAGLLKFKHISLSGLRPAAGEAVTWMGAQTFRWRILTDLKLAAPPSHRIVYFATFLETGRWLQTRFCLEDMEAPFIVYLDGKAQKTAQERGENEGGGRGWCCDLDLANGKHTLVIKALLKKGKGLQLKSFLQNKETFADDKIEVSLDPSHRLEERHILNLKRVRNIDLSPDGLKAAVSLRQTMADSGKDSGWLEILDTGSGGVMFSSENLSRMGGFRWLSDSNRFSYTRSDKGKTTVFLFNLKTRQQRCLVKGIENFNSYWWAADDSFLIYSVYSRQKNKEGYRHFKGIPDRTDWSGYKYSLYIFYPAGDVSHRISGEEDNFRSVEIAPDSRRALLIKSLEDYKNRPYDKKVIHLLSLENFSSRPLLAGNWIDEVQWSPEGKRLLVVGGPSAFDGIGSLLADDVIPNDFDKQAFLFDLNTEKVESITRGFDPSIESAFWSRQDNNIYFRATDRSFVRLYRYSTRKKSFLPLAAGVDYVSRIDFGRLKNTAVFWGCGATDPYKLYRLDLYSGQAALLKDFNEEEFRRVRLGRLKDWNFKTEEGKTIMGRLYFPPDFDPSKKYPCIVYYYGGTSPVARDFGGRYPKNWYAANGYIVYVLQPSGAVGFGQENSALHVNDWGKITSGEIIGGVKELVKAHPYIDPHRIGAMGASYGGFLTQYLAAQTDIFAAFISHAGITALSSYWGVGDWGYTYSGIATAGSFPWNRQDIYVARSPLFLADKISRPLLLLHGADDNNVPPGESFQMYTALKLLGKEVALVTFAGQKHFILEYRKRRRWMHTIIAWFDRWLKDQPQHWHHLYGE
jgi:dipeptidyl aminopeptidase/acylaminoacyl peptidase